ncbi:MAG: hypothetical protein WC299_01435 [Kiritimatiellia bacterium]
MKDAKAFVKVSPRDSRYLELDNGKPYVPIGLNLVGSPDPQDYEKVLNTMAQNRLNYCRVWLNHGSFDIERERSGVFDKAAANNLGKFLVLAGERGIRVKLCLEYFRAVTAKKNDFFDSTLHHQANGGPFTDMEDFLRSAKGLAQFKEKLAWYRRRIGDNPAVFAWELWNEMNCVGPISVWAPWTRRMLAELHRLFPKNMAVQSLGSFDRQEFRCMYGVLVTLAGNDVAQVHRYLDLGAQWDVCHGPVDFLAAEAVRELQALGPEKPIILAESGAVEPCHSGPFKLYQKDKEGVLLHDLIWAPFMAGAAGPGQSWHWDKYVQPNKLWWHFARFAGAIEGIDPPAEKFEPVMIEHPRLRIYVLRGKKTVLAWCRDRQDDWRSELQEGKAPETLAHVTVDLSSCLSSPAGWKVRAYNPWTGAWQALKPDAADIILPPFSRSLALRMEVE